MPLFASKSFSRNWYASIIPSGDAATADSRFIITRSISVMGRATASVERPPSEMAEVPSRAASRKVFFIRRTLVSEKAASKGIAKGLEGPPMARHQRTILPSFITSAICSNAVMLVKGFAFTATRSAKRPAAIAPNIFSFPNNSAARIVALWIACIGVMP